ncbi:hypothetical protein [Terrisporobacter mayombei]|uniref:Uncharacterized protein n=1 Tax=Terrisporobacter mayombei TaxID=1541 RepID=A0ABY9Q4R8_9FIRM|nr:hypothetical protein [Terrisporobacter mayombei]MCC3867752.1 hypothetical protein [Terrisporobacter mayombei]WMT82015.1 hypothetical protein TEMA_23660 [Terrisporobacter mayombei]
MAIYKMSELSVTAPAEGSAGVIITSNPTLTNETYSLASGVVKEGSVAIEGAAVVLVEIIASPASSKNVAIAYTDVKGKFGIPYEFSTNSGTTYQLDVYTPNTLS